MFVKVKVNEEVETVVGVLSSSSSSGCNGRSCSIRGRSKNTKGSSSSINGGSRCSKRKWRSRSGGSTCCSVDAVKVVVVAAIELVILVLKVVIVALVVGVVVSSCRSITYYCVHL